MEWRNLSSMYRVRENRKTGEDSLFSRLSLTLTHCVSTISIKNDIKDLKATPAQQPWPPIDPDPAKKPS